MTQAKKVENYSTTDTQAIVGKYTDCGTDVTEAAHNKRAEVVKALAKKYGKSERSIRSKLVTQKVYIARAKFSGVTGEKPAKKEAIAASLVGAFGQIEIDGKMVGLNAESMEKANKTDLQTLLTFFNRQVVEDAEETASEETASEES